MVAVDSGAAGMRIYDLLIASLAPYCYGHRATLGDGGRIMTASEQSCDVVKRRRESRACYKPWCTC